MGDTRCRAESVVDVGDAMNVHRNIRAWDDWAASRGYANLYTFLYDFYVDKQMSLTGVGEMMGIRRDRVADLLRINGIPVKGRGGVHV